MAFSKILETETSIVVGLLGNSTEDNLDYKSVLKIAQFYNIKIEPDKFGYHFITSNGVIKKGYAHVNNYNDFLEIFK
ncbi:MAG: hypothetical protein E6X19_01865 [Hungatella hathewayi]|jgi:hypothetical protein|uniref:hypothetical protein n=1 Tax=Bacteria TaxID=2 RepID=UPI00290872F3|nr:hypothetical protein [Hungatella hathewayi]